MKELIDITPEDLRDMDEIKLIANILADLEDTHIAVRELQTELGKHMMNGMVHRAVSILPGEYEFKDKIEDNFGKLLKELKEPKRYSVAELRIKLDYDCPYTMHGEAAQFLKWLDESDL